MLDSVIKPRRGDGLRKKLIATAIECFSRHGYQGTSIDRIARAAGVTKGALYYHFRDKEDLLLGAIDDRIGGFEQQVVDDARRLRDPVAVIRTIAGVCADQVETSNQRRFILTLMVETLDTHPDLSARFRTMMRRFREFITHTVRLGQEKGVFRTDVDPEEAARLFVSNVLGIELQYYLDPEAIPLHESMRGVAARFLERLRPVVAGAD